MELGFRKFQRVDFPEYFSWFQDHELNQYLGPMQEDDEWLKAVLSEQSDSIDYSVLVGNMLVAVVGLYLPKAGYPHFVISNLAVKPSLRGQTIGKKVIEELVKRHALLPGQSWLAFVDKENSSAWRLFTKCGWKRVTNGSIRVRLNEKRAAAFRQRRAHPKYEKTTQPLALAGVEIIEQN